VVLLERVSIKRRLKRGEVVIGTFLKFNSAAIAEMLGYAGFDFVIIDGEHSPFTYPEMEQMIRAANGAGADAVIRIPSYAGEHVLHAADIGAQGVQIPSVGTIEQAEDAVRELRYYPNGSRGFALTQRAAKYTFMSKDEYFNASEEDVLSVVHVENLEMAAKVEELCKIPQIDVLFIGPGDLSQATGHPGELNHPEVVALVERITAEALKNGKMVGVFCGSKADIEKYTKLGIQYIAFGSDLAMIAAKFKDVSKDIASVR
jgi:4-hydroxy-2-oxoheptanedioate aldolase